MANIKSHLFAAAFAFVFVASLALTPAQAANRDIVQLQTEVDQLQQAMTQMKQSFDERMGVMRNLLEKNTDSANKVSAAIDSLQTSLNKQQTERGAQVEQISGQIQALNDTMDEVKARLAKLSKQFDDMQAAQQSMAAQQSQTQQQTQQDGGRSTARRALQQRVAGFQRREYGPGHAGVQGLYQVLSGHGSGWERLLLPGGNAI